jgi:arginine/lysine/ornithine decarboxylase
MAPQDAYAALVANEVDYVPLEEIKGRISATLALIYPPGIGVVVPGERWDQRAKPMLDYFRFSGEQPLPGFANEIRESSMSRWRTDRPWQRPNRRDPVRIGTGRLIGAPQKK